MAALPAVLIVASLTACGGSKANPAPRATIAATAAAIIPVAPTPTPGIAALVSIVWATSLDPTTGAPADPVKSFPPDAPVIYAVVSVRDVSQGLTLTAAWSYNGTALAGKNGAAVAQTAIAAGWVEFHLAQAAGQQWPVGTYKITVTQAGGASISSSIEVKRSSP